MSSRRPSSGGDFVFGSEIFSYNISDIRSYIPYIEKIIAIRWPLTLLFEDFEVIIWLGQTLTFGLIITMVTESFGTCCHGYHGNAINLYLFMHR